MRRPELAVSILKEKPKRERESVLKLPGRLDRWSFLRRFTSLNIDDWMLFQTPRSLVQVNLKLKASSNSATAASFEGLDNFPLGFQHIFSFIKEISFNLLTSLIFVSDSVSKTKIVGFTVKRLCRRHYGCLHDHAIQLKLCCT